jgi:serine/threonine-protein kinase HipA
MTRKMNETVRYSVWLYECLVGYLYTHHNFSWYEFTEDYLADPFRPVLGLRFEEDLRGRVAANLRLPPWFSNLLPESPLRAWIAAERGVSQDREMQLLAQVGHDLPGAIRVLPGGVHAVDDLQSIAAQLSLNAEDAAPDHRWRFSLAGVGLKFSMLRTGDRFTCTATGEGGDWILKLPDPHYRDVPTNEYVMMRFAEAVGIDAPDVTMVHRDQIDNLPEVAWPGTEEWAFAVRRFDRTNDRGSIHIEDLAQVRGFYPGQKYEGNYETIAALIYRGHDEVALEEFARRLTFFVLIGNGDAHLKNWSLIYRNRRAPTLSPVYDVVATEAYRPSPEPEALGLRFGGTRRFESVRTFHFDLLAEKLGTDSDLSSVAVQVVHRTVENWARFEEGLAGQPAIREIVGQSIRDRSRSLLRGSVARP